jgi:hypothetical protein
VTRICKLYSDIYLTTEEKARKNFVEVVNISVLFKIHFARMKTSFCIGASFMLYEVHGFMMAETCSCCVPLFKYIVCNKVVLDCTVGLLDCTVGLLDCTVGLLDCTVIYF